MKTRILFLTALLAAPAFGQAPAQCILAGRVSAGEWAPRFEAVELRGADGRVISATDRASLVAVKSAELSEPALLSRCDGDRPLARGPGEPGGKTPVPALTAGVVDVLGVSFPKLRGGAELVELRVRVPAERVTQLTR